ncbi:Membrane steroid-binding protein 1 [Sphaceloma murrayae]|uniref:Membrane steroid-binding protein 1 n=1 Tax=Sphaceloma murrayae TaxID=2082308 RepID=A0A2K1QTI7_9PEZI|nr:Membrane steroid-binding protein 1 [Sphaceloma murrayae]
MAEVRRRGPQEDSIRSKIQEEDDNKPLKHSVSFVDILRILGGLALLNTALSYYITGDSFLWGHRPWWVKPGRLQTWLSGPLHLTDAELAAYDGTDTTKPIYLALNGTIYDVTVGRNYYGPGGMYGFFSGKEATRAFITGCFDTDLTPDTRGIEEMYIPLDDEEADKALSKGELKTRRERETRLAKEKVRQGIEGWAKVFRGDTGKNYFVVGKVKREEGWLEKMPQRELCEKAKGQRKKRKPGQ